MAAFRFMALSTDLQALMISHVRQRESLKWRGLTEHEQINRPSDMVSLCLTCKKLHEITVRQLYYEISLDVGSPADLKLSAFLNPKNIGLKYIRRLELYLAGADENCGNQLQQAHLATRMIIEFLPEDILERFRYDLGHHVFRYSAALTTSRWGQVPRCPLGKLTVCPCSWHPWSPFSAESLLLLYRKQRRMKWFEALQLDRDIADEIEQKPEFNNAFSEARQLGLFPDNMDSLQLGQKMLSRMPKIEKLVVHADFKDHDQPPGIPPLRALNDSSIGPGIIASTLFRHMQPFATCTPMALKQVTLQCISLRYASGSYCRVIDFTTVQQLHILGCPGTDAFLAELCTSAQLPARLETLEVKFDDNREQDTLNALEEFLCLVSGLENLVIDVTSVKSLPQVASIVRHKRTLRSVNVHGCDCPTDVTCMNEHVFDAAAFRELGSQCKHIEQLSIAFPEMMIFRRSPNDENPLLTVSGTLALGVPLCLH